MSDITGAFYTLTIMISYLLLFHKSLNLPFFFTKYSYILTWEEIARIYSAFITTAEKGGIIRVNPIN